MLGIIGGSGFYSLLEDTSSPTWEGGRRYGEPAARPVVGRIGGNKVAFLPRHGINHQFPPHLVPYRANLYAMRQIGVSHVIATCAVGSLSLNHPPGSFVIPDQIVDRTWGRESTYNEVGGIRRAGVFHLPCVDPYDQELSELILESGPEACPDVEMIKGGTVCVINGPRFSTRAESLWYQAQGWDLLNMTQAPEAFLAKELGLSYAAVAVVTDYDFGLDLEDQEPVTHEMVLQNFEKSLGELKNLLTAFAMKWADVTNL